MAKKDILTFVIFVCLSFSLQAQTSTVSKKR